MEKHVDLTDAEFEDKFKSCELKPEIFSHEAHIRLAWIHVMKYRVEAAIQTICSQLPKLPHDSYRVGA